MRPWPWISLCVMIVAACGNEPPAAPPAPPPKVAGPSKPPEPVPDSVKADNRQRDEALQGITGAKTAEEAQLARDSYTGTKHAVNLDVALERKLRELDFSAFNAAKAAVLKTATPSAAVAAAKEYTGERYASDLDKALWDHMKAMVKKDPSLASQLPARPVAGVSTADVGNTLESLRKALESATTESQAASMRAKFNGDFPPDEIESVLEHWRFGKASWRQLIHLKTPNRYTHAAMLYAGGYIELAPYQGKLLRYDTDGECTLTLGTDTQKVELAALSPDCRSLITVSHLGVAQVRDLVTGTAGPEFRMLEEPRGRKLALNNGAVTAAASSSQRNIRLWGTDPGTQLLECENPKGPQVGSLAFSPSGKYLIAGVQGGAKLFDAATGKELFAFGAEKGEFPYVALAPDEATIAVLSIVGKTIWLYSTQTGNAIRSIAVSTTHTGPPPQAFLEWLPSGRNLCASIANAEVAFYEVTSGKLFASHAAPKNIFPNRLTPFGNGVTGSLLDSDGIKLHCLGRPD